MTIIAVGGLLPKFNMPTTIRKLSWIIKGNFEFLGFEQNQNNSKTCYLKLSPKVNVSMALKKINETPSGKLKFKAFIPDRVPPLIGKTRILPDRLRRVMNIPLEVSPHQCFKTVHNEIIHEMEYKYTGLLNLSKKTNHKLMENICIKVAERLRQVAQRSEAADSPFKLSMAYRKAHPHFGDFQLILSTLHMLEDAQAQPRSQISEKELTMVNQKPHVVSKFEKADEVCKKYSERILKKVMDHINRLKTDSHPEQSEEEVARVNVRKQLKKLIPYLPQIVREVTNKHFKPVQPPTYKVKIYGEPYLPRQRGTIDAFLKQHGCYGVRRSELMYNLLNLKVGWTAYSRILEQDGVVLDGHKLTIRAADTPKYKIPEHVANRISLSPEQQQNYEEVAMEEEAWEEW